MSHIYRKVAFSGEAHFHIRVSENPQVTVEKHMRSQRVVVWYGMWTGASLSPFFSEN